MREEGFDVVRRVVPDESELISAAIAELATDALLVLTTGGTGFAPRDVTPEATHAVLHRQAPGISEAIRADALERTPHALLSRGAGRVARGHADREPPGLAWRMPGRLRGRSVPPFRHGLELAAGDRETPHRQT